MAKPRHLRIFEDAPGTIPCSHCAGAGAFEYSDRPFGRTTTWRNCIACDGTGVTRCEECREPATVSLRGMGFRCKACADYLQRALAAAKES